MADDSADEKAHKQFLLMANTIEACLVKLEDTQQQLAAVTKERDEIKVELTAAKKDLATLDRVLDVTSRAEDAARQVTDEVIRHLTKDRDSWKSQYDFMANARAELIRERDEARHQAELCEMENDDLKREVERLRAEAASLRDATLEEAAKEADGFVDKKRDWVPDSLYGTLRKEVARDIRWLIVKGKFAVEGTGGGA